MLCLLQLFSIILYTRRIQVCLATTLINLLSVFFIYIYIYIKRGEGRKEVKIIVRCLVYSIYSKTALQAWRFCVLSKDKMRKDNFLYLKEVSYTILTKAVMMYEDVQSISWPRQDIYTFTNNSLLVLSLGIDLCCLYRSIEATLPSEYAS